MCPQVVLILTSSGSDRVRSMCRSPSTQTTKGTKSHQGNPLLQTSFVCLCALWGFRNFRETSSMTSFFRHKLLIIGSREQRIQLARILQFDFHDPRDVSVFIDLFRSSG